MWNNCVRAPEQWAFPCSFFLQERLGFCALFLHVAEAAHEPALKFVLVFRNSETYSKDYRLILSNTHCICKMKS